MKNASSAAGSGVAAKEYFASLQDVLAHLDFSVIDRMTDAIWENYRRDRALYIFGNGGKAALTFHFSCDIGKGTIAAGRKGLANSGFSENVALTSAVDNDLSYADF